MPLSPAQRALHFAPWILLLGYLLTGCRPQLEPSMALERTIELGERQRISLDLEAGSFYHLLAEQPTADVLLRLLDPAGRPVDVDVDATTLGQPEPLYFIAPESGRYVLEVHGFKLSKDAENGRGRYSLSMRPPHKPSGQDRLVTEAFWAESRALEFDAVEEDCPKAIVEYSKAAELWQKAGRSENVVPVLLERGDCYFRLGQVSEAHRDFERVLELATAAGHDLQRLHAYSSLGSTSRALGRLDRAFHYHQLALASARDIGEVRHIGRTLNSLCLLFVELGRHQDAVESCREAIELYDRAGWKTRRIRSLNNLGWAYQRVGQWPQAEAIFRRALSLDPAQTRLTLTLLGNQAQALEKLGRLEPARQLLDRALELSVELEQPGTEARYRARRARLLTALGELEPSRLEVDRALALLEQVDSLLNELSVLADCAQALWLAGSLERAVDVAERAFTRLERLRQSPQDFDDRAGLLASRWSIYDLRVAIRMSLFESTGDEAWRDAALHAAEQARARGLLDRLQSSELPRLSVLEPADIERRLLGEHTGLLLFHLGERKSFLWRLARGETAVFELPPMAEIQAAVQPLHEALTARDLEVAGEGARQRSRRVRAADEAVWTAGARLAGALMLTEALGAARQRVQESSAPGAASAQPTKRWLVVPDGVLHRVPFAALPLGLAAKHTAVEHAAGLDAAGLDAAGVDAAGVDVGGLRPLLADFEIVYAPSASSLAALRTTAARRPAEKGLLALADPVFERVDPRNPRAARERPAGRGEVDIAHGAELRALPLTRDEVAEIARLMPPESVVATGHDASKSRLLAADVSEFAYLHLATHGLLDARDASRSSLMLSRFDPSGRAVDGAVTMKELSGLELGARLVVLSACHSASGRELRGEGVLGLARGFLNAGVPRVIASQWTVQDGVTHQLMASFYRKVWLEGESPSAALRASQLELWRRGLPAYHWAVFSFQGEWT